MRTLGLADPAFVTATAVAPSGYDTDAAAYIAAVETADGQALETAVADAINAFVVGCKADGIWDAIKASCIMAGARTLEGALVPLVGVAPTNVGPFVAGDYDRKIGLLFNGTSKYINSNRANNTEPQNSKHIGMYLSKAASIGILFSARSIGNAGNTYADLSSGGRYQVNGDLVITGTAPNANSFLGIGRSTASTMSLRLNRASSELSANSSSPNSASIAFGARINTTTGTAENFTDYRLAFYSIGESLDLALLDARVTTLINAFAAAIP